MAESPAHSLVHPFSEEEDSSLKTFSDEDDEDSENESLENIAVQNRHRPTVREQKISDL
jgi:hypothetical protein